MKKVSLLLSSMFLLVAMVIVATTASAQVPVSGEQEFQAKCGFCHGAFGQGKVGPAGIAGSAGHLERFGIPPQAVVGQLTGLVREGIPGRMPAFPPEVLSDAGIAAIADFLISNPPATGTNVYIANCAMCHGMSGEGVIGPPLNTAEEFIAMQGWTPQQLVQELRMLVDGGIPGRMPSFPHLTDIEVERLAVAITSFDDIQYWEKVFTEQKGMPPTLWDRYEWAWGIEFQARYGRPPTSQEREANAALTRGGDQAGGPPPGAAPSGR